MTFLRLLNIARTIRLEREVAAIPGMKRGIKSLAESIGRQAPAGSETELRAAVVLLDGRVHALEIAAGVARQYLDSERHQAARDVLASILDAEPVNQRKAS